MFIFFFVLFSIRQTSKGVFANSFFLEHQLCSYLWICNESWHFDFDASSHLYMSFDFQLCKNELFLSLISLFFCNWFFPMNLSGGFEHFRFLALDSASCVKFNQLSLRFMTNFWSAFSSLVCGWQLEGNFIVKGLTTGRDFWLCFLVFYGL